MNAVQKTFFTIAAMFGVWCVYYTAWSGSSYEPAPIEYQMAIAEMQVANCVARERAKLPKYTFSEAPFEACAN